MWVTEGVSISRMMIIIKEIQNVIQHYVFFNILSENCATRWLVHTLEAPQYHGSLLNPSDEGSETTSVGHSWQVFISLNKSSAMHFTECN